jgi:hypothetical protein
MKRLAAALALGALFGAAASAQEKPPANASNISDIFPGQCRTLSGEAVKFEYYNSPAVRVARSIAHPKRGPLVQINADYFNAATPLISQRFFAAHECAHHSLGHIAAIGELARQNQPLYPQDIQRMELEADCAAARNIQDGYGYKPEDIVNTLLTAPASDRFTHFSNEVRTDNVKNCLAPPSLR